MPVRAPLAVGSSRRRTCALVLYASFPPPKPGSPTRPGGAGAGGASPLYVMVTLQGEPRERAAEGTDEGAVRGWSSGRAQAAEQATDIF
jgi:hypothetical protein